MSGGWIGEKQADTLQQDRAVDELIPGEGGGRKTVPHCGINVKSWHHSMASDAHNLKAVFSHHREHREKRIFSGADIFYIVDKALFRRKPEQRSTVGNKV